MQITFTGAARTVTGSRHLLRVNGHQVLLDCGLYQGRRSDTYERNLNFPFPPASIDAVVLSHAHIDHSGNLPNLVRQGYTGPIHGTRATAHLTDVMTRDSARIQEDDIAFLNKRRARRGEAPVEPLYTTPDAERAAKLLVGQTYDTRFEVVPGVSARLVEAGHMLGSAGVVLDLEEKGRRLRLMFSGDIGRRDLPLLRDPVLPHDVDILIMESTYGDTVHDTADKAYEQLLTLIRRAMQRGGKIIIPAFAVGRAQTLVYYLHLMVDHGDLPRLPVFVDSPLAINVTDIFRQHPEDFDEETLAFTRRDPHHSPFGFDLLTYTRSVEESKAINDIKEPVVIISASGMAETGRILHHLRNNIEEPRNMIILTSWMAPDTLGRQLLEGAASIKIFGEAFDVRAEVAQIDGLSAHAGQDYLVTYANALRGRVKQVFLVHGEPKPAEALREKLADLGAPVHYPALGDQVEV